MLTRCRPNVLTVIHENPKWQLQNFGKDHKKWSAWRVCVCVCYMHFVDLKNPNIFSILPFVILVNQTNLRGEIFHNVHECVPLATCMNYSKAPHLTLKLESKCVIAGRGRKVSLLQWNCATPLCAVFLRLFSSGSCLCKCSNPSYNNDFIY